MASIQGYKQQIFTYDLFDPKRFIVTEIKSKNSAFVKNLGLKINDVIELSFDQYNFCSGTTDLAYFVKVTNLSNNKSLSGADKGMKLLYSLFKIDNLDKSRIQRVVELEPVI